MSKISFEHFHVKRFRSLLDVAIKISDSSPVVICGENNIGKTNFLRALNLFFNHINDIEFNPKEDIPHHIYEGSRGAGSKTELIGTFLKDGNRSTVKVTFKDTSTLYHLNNKETNYIEVSHFFEAFQYLFIESHNVNLPSLIAKVLEKDGLLPLDTKRSKQSKPLEALEEFIRLSQVAIKDIESDINDCFKKLTDFDGVLKGKEVKINFAEFDKLRDVIKNMTEITLYDGNDHSIALKGSGAQRALFLALMDYISRNYRKNVIWGVDEPEAFLQPKLQNKVAEVFLDTVTKKKLPIIITTHSPKFINLGNLKETYLFKGKQEKRTYERKPNLTFFEMDTYKETFTSDIEKAIAIKDHLGIETNDGWDVLPKNVIVEGEEDKKYLELLLSLEDLPIPNIIWSGGASKIAANLQYYNMFADNIGFKPYFTCIFDNDDEGRTQALKVRPNSVRNIEINILPLPRFDGITNPTNKNNSDGNWEIEDFFPPEMMIEALNILLKKEKYKRITQLQILNRAKPANIRKGVLEYAEECCASNNPDKPSLELEDEGRKKQLCRLFCEMLPKVWETNRDKFDMQLKFVKNLY